MLHAYFYEKLGNLSREKNRERSVMFGGTNNLFIIRLLQSVVFGPSSWAFWCFMLTLYRHRTQVWKDDTGVLKKEHCSCCARGVSKCG